MTVEEYLNKPLGHEKITLRLLKRLSKNPIIFDIGACEGLDSLRYHKLFDNCEIYSFEPDPDNFNICQELFSTYPRVHCQNMALGSKIGESTFFSSFSVDEQNDIGWNHGNKSGSLLEPDLHLKKYSNIKFEQKFHVTVGTIEEFCEKNSIPQINFLHMDVQGMELEVLKGANRYMEKIQSIWMEVSNFSMYKGQPLKKDVEDFMKQKGFKLLLDKGGKMYGDQLYVRATDYKSLSLLTRFYLNLIRNII